MKYHIKDCNEDVIDQFLLAGLLLLIKENRFCTMRRKEYGKEEKFLVGFVR